MLFSTWKVLEQTAPAFDRLDKRKSLEIATLRNCSKDISSYCSHWSLSGVTTESELLVAKVGIFGKEETLRLDTICPHHKLEPGLGWRRNSSECGSLRWSLQNTQTMQTADRRPCELSIFFIFSFLFVLLTRKYFWFWSQINVQLYIGVFVMHRPRQLGMRLLTCYRLCKGSSI